MHRKIRKHTANEILYYELQVPDTRLFLKIFWES